MSTRHHAQTRKFTRVRSRGKTALLHRKAPGRYRRRPDGLRQDDACVTESGPRAGASLTEHQSCHSSCTRPDGHPRAQSSPAPNLDASQQPLSRTASPPKSVAYSVTRCARRSARHALSLTQYLGGLYHSIRRRLRQGTHSNMLHDGRHPLPRDHDRPLAKQVQCNHGASYTSLTASSH